MKGAKMTSTDKQPCREANMAANTDKEIWRERVGDYYADSIFVTKEGMIGIDCGGYVCIKPVRHWHALAYQPQDADEVKLLYTIENAMGVITDTSGDTAFRILQAVRPYTRTPPISYEAAVEKPLKSSKAVVYAVFYPLMRQVAYEHGYSISLHGSMIRDCDMIAIPWRGNPKPYIEMIKAFGKVIGYQYDDIYIKANISDKPLGRVAINLNIGGDCWIDLSIITLAAMGISEGRDG